MIETMQTVQNMGVTFGKENASAATMSIKQTMNRPIVDVDEFQNLRKMEVVADNVR